MEALKTFDFGQLIAFVLPGLVAARAAAYYLASVQRALDKAASGGDGAIGPLVFILIAGATCGLTISILRQQWLDPVFGKVFATFKWPDPGHEGSGAPLKVERPHWRPNYRAIAGSKECAEVYDKAVANVYRYYQFITNLGVATVVLAFARWHQYAISPTHPHGLLDGARLLGLAGAILIVTGYQQFVGWCRVHSQITVRYGTPNAGPPPTATATTTAASSPAAATSPAPAVS